MVAYMMDNVKGLRGLSCFCLAVNVKKSADSGRPDSYIDMKSEGECYNFGIVSIRAASGHDIKAQVEGCIDIGFTRWSWIKALAKSSGIFPLWIPSDTPSWICNDKSFELVGMFTHIVDCGAS